MGKCAHVCNHYKGCDGVWYIDCSVFDKSVPSECCGEDCCEYDEEGKEETDET